MAQTRRRSVEMPGGDLVVLQPEESAELPDTKAVEWAPIAPYWSVLWRSGVELAREVASAPEVPGRVVELGCGLALPSIAAARTGASVLATDGDEEGLEAAQRNAGANGVAIETLAADWNDPEELVAGGPFDLVLAADVLYEKRSAELLLDLVPRLAPQAWIADPGRAASAVFLEEADSRWTRETVRRGVVSVNRFRITP